MSNKIEYNRDRVWDNIVAKQKKEKRRRWFLIFFIGGVLGLGSYGIYNYSQTDKVEAITNTLDNTTNNTEKTINQSVIKTETNSNQEFQIEEKSESFDTKNDKGKIVNETTQTPIVNPSKTPLSNADNYNIDGEVNTNASSNIALEDSENVEETGGELQLMSDSEEQSLAQSSQQSELVTAELPSVIAQNSLIDYRSIQSLLPSALRAKDYTFESLVLPQIDVFQEKEILVRGVSLFAANTFSYGSLHFDAKDASYVENRQSKEKINFVNGTTLGIEVPLNKRWFLQSGINLDIISSTYRHRQEGIVLGQDYVQSDTAVIYNNTVMPGLKEVNQIGSRKIVKNNEVIKLGVPLMLGYRKNLGAWDLKALVGGRINFSQSFHGVISGMDGVHMVDDAEINQAYYSNRLGLKLQTQLLFSRPVNESTDVFFGLQYSLPEFQLNKSESYIQDYHTVGLTFGVSLNLKNQ